MDEQDHFPVPDSVKIVKADYDLKIKVGSGGFAPEAVATAEKRLAAAKSLFPSAAMYDIKEIEKSVIHLQSSTLSRELILRTHSAAMELKLNSELFQYPLVTAVSNSLCQFCNNISETTPLVAEVIELHLRTLRIAIEQGPRAITEKDEKELLSGLVQATEKALKAQK